MGLARQETLPAAAAETILPAVASKPHRQALKNKQSPDEIIVGAFVIFTIG
jgi:hypothetical protein